ncbi:uroporphyrinogen-III synthase [Thiomicrorhabdus sp.]|uniref:uroporphyrinogen-III synthase n=1 Tax=Thiomicrorhabdus sp. TaxID=2039724 RepID=UPI0029C671D8|nr:uroporphyrinogen-III synthase [Thiomicrorhabdus sp.]
MVNRLNTTGESFAFLNTRPLAQAGGLQQKMAALGVKSVLLPTLRIRWCHFSCRDLNAVFDQVVVTSVNALQSWQEGLQSMSCEEKAECLNAVSTARWLAIGAKTQEVGRGQGLPLHCFSREKFDSEALLADASMQSLDGQKILMLKGHGGRRKLVETFAERGAQVFELNLYKRCREEFDSEGWRTFKRAARPVILFSSLDSYLALKAMLNTESHPWRSVYAAIVFSARIGEYLRKDGWSAEIEVVETQSDEGVVEAMRRVINS